MKNKKYLISGTVDPHNIEILLNKMKFLGIEGVWTENRPTEQVNLKCKYSDRNDIPDDVGIRERYCILMAEDTAGLIMYGERWSKFSVYETEYKMAKLLGLSVYEENELDCKILCKVGHNEDVEPEVPIDPSVEGGSQNGESTTYSRRWKDEKR